MSNDTIARRYSAALADVVVKTGESETVKSELAAWSEIFETNSNLSGAFNSPAVAHINKENLLEELIARANPSKVSANFLRILLRNGRLADFSAINERFLIVLDERSGVVSAEITSARELPANEREAFHLNLEHLTRKKVKIEFSVDQDIIGGVVTRIGSTVYDGSVRTKLEALKEQLVNG